MARMIQCIKLGREAEGLDFPPYPGELGKRIYENVSKEAWAQWLKHQTMLVNENRLSLADPRARKYLAEQMERHFFGGGADVASGYVPPKECSGADRGGDVGRQRLPVLQRRSRRDSARVRQGPAGSRPGRGQLPQGRHQRPAKSDAGICAQ